MQQSNWLCVCRLRLAFVHVSVRSHSYFQPTIRSLTFRRRDFRRCSLKRAYNLWARKMD